MDQARRGKAIGMSGAWVVALLSVAAGFAFARCSIPGGVLFLCESGGRCRDGFFCGDAGYCLPNDFLDAGCEPVPLGTTWAAGGSLYRERAEFTLDPAEVSGADLIAIGGMHRGDLGDGGTVADVFDVLASSD